MAATRAAGGVVGVLVDDGADWLAGAAATGLGLAATLVAAATAATPVLDRGPAVTMTSGGSVALGAGVGARWPAAVITPHAMGDPPSALAVTISAAPSSPSSALTWVLGSVAW
jgi:hypothetical protein